MHYGSGVFEGIRAYPTSTGVAVFRLRDHIDRCSPPPGLPHRHPFSRRAHRGVARGGAVNGLDDGCYIRPSSTSATARWLEPDALPGPGGDRRWPWAPTSATRCGQRGLVQDQLLAAPRPQRRPDRGQGHGHVRQLVPAKVEALKAGYDERSCSRPTGRSPSARARTSSSSSTGASSRRTPPTPARSRGSRRSRSRPSHATWAHRQLRALIRTDLYAAEEAFLTGTAAEVVPIRAVDDRPIGDGARTHHQGDPSGLLRHRARPVDRYKDWLDYVD